MWWKDKENINAYSFAIIVTFGYLCLFIFGIIWLKNGFDVEKKFMDVDKKIEILDSNKVLMTEFVELNNQEYKKIRKEIQELENKIMESAFKGRNKWK